MATSTQAISIIKKKSFKHGFSLLSFVLDWIKPCGNSNNYFTFRHGLRGGKRAQSPIFSTRCHCGSALYYQSPSIMPSPVWCSVKHENLKSSPVLPLWSVGYECLQPPNGTHLWLLFYFICIIWVFASCEMPLHESTSCFWTQPCSFIEEPRWGRYNQPKASPLITAGETKCCDIRLCNPLSSEKCIQSRSNLSLSLEQYRDMKLLLSLDEWQWWFFCLFVLLVFVEHWS